jgi:hypothetical protein
MTRDELASFAAGLEVGDEVAVSNHWTGITTIEKVTRKTPSGMLEVEKRLFRKGRWIGPIYSSSLGPVSDELRAADSLRRNVNRLCSFWWGRLDADRIARICAVLDETTEPRR